MNKIEEKFKIDISVSYEKQELLAKNYLGVYGLVYKAINKKTLESCLLKEIDLKGVPQSGRQEIYKEAIFLSQLQHENFLKFMGFQEMKDTLLYVIEYPDELLSDYISSDKEISPDFLFNIIINVLMGLQFLQKKVGNLMGKIEINLDNIVICKNGTIKLCDVIENLKIIKNIRIEQGLTSNDNKGFFPPEEFSLNSIAVQKDNSTEFKSLIFSLGMIICKLADQESFNKFVESRLLNDTYENLNNLLISIKEKINIELFETLILMINFEPILRHDIDSLLNFLKYKGKLLQKKEENIEDLTTLKELVKKKDKDIFILKDQLRVVNEQNQKLSQENDKIRHKTVTIGNEKESPQ